MKLREVVAKRSVSSKYQNTAWKPVDLACVLTNSEEEIIVRTKLIRDPLSAGACISEAISRDIFAELGIKVADAYAVVVGSEFAAGLTAQFQFDPPVIAGRHWGTQLIETAVETTLTSENYSALRQPEDVFLIYLTDVLLAYRDRQNHGNVLLVAALGGKRVDVVPIDQSDCFCGPAVMCDFTELWEKKDQSIAAAFAGLEQLVIDRGAEFVNKVSDHIIESRASILDSVTAPPDEWYDRAGIDPDHLRDFLAYRLEHLRDLARLDWWRGLKAAAEGGEYEFEL